MRNLCCTVLLRYIKPFQSITMSTPIQIGLCILLVFCSCSSQKAIVIHDNLALKKVLKYQEDFEKGLENWSVEQMEGGTVKSVNGKMEITDVAGCTVWFKQQLTAPLLIEYDVVVVDQGGPQDRVSDLNCFWLATDPRYPQDFFAGSQERRGQFKDYNPLQLYYVGLGGHNNTKTRFRRYTGDGNKPLLPEHDLSAPEFLITPNQVNHIKIVAHDNIIQYYRNDILIYDFIDPAPYRQGYFGIRTVNNHMLVDNFRVYTLHQN